MRKILAIFFGKIIILIGKIINKGTCFPGTFASILEPNILTKIAKPKLTIAVTSTSGKTSTSSIIANLLKENGYQVGHNLSGANIDMGIITMLIEHSNLKGKLKVDAIVMEVDERHTKNVFPFFKPDYLVINNIARDQATRNGNVETIVNALNKSISDDIHLIVNADDAHLNSFLLNKKNQKTFFGINVPSKFKGMFFNNNDISYCPLCQEKIIFEQMYFCNTGIYHCPTSDFKRPIPKYEVTEVDLEKGFYHINNNLKVFLQNKVFFHVYNSLAAFTVCKTIGIDESEIIKNLDKIHFNITRVFQQDNINVMACKNSSPISYDQGLIQINSDPQEKILVLGFHRISNRDNYQDLSWLYDINFELLLTSNIHKIIIIGEYGFDIASRLYIADFPLEKIIFVKNIQAAINQTKEYPYPTYALLGFDITQSFIDKIKEEKS